MNTPIQLKARWNERNNPKKLDGMNITIQLKVRWNEHDNPTKS